MKLSFCSSVWPGKDLSSAASMIGQIPIRSGGSEMVMDIGMPQEIGTNNTLIVAVIIEDDAFDHMFNESKFHGNEDGTVGGDDGSVSDFDLSANRELH
uniref:Uncharacterized protein n=1 Tax=Romanomermis culicivorax TaxID=13658 RepID=A0A915JU75_ROMCU